MKRDVLFCFLIHIAGTYCKKAGRGTPTAPLTATDFKKVVARPSFIDKTLLIKTLLNSSDNALITAPRGFGKSTNLDMVKRFLEAVVDEDGQLMSSVQQGENNEFVEKSESDITENFKLFKKYNLKIYQDKQFFYKHCGQRPVIFVDFKLLEGGTHKDFMEDLKTVIHKAFLDHVYLLKRKEIWSSNVKDENKFDKGLFNKYCNEKKFGKLKKREMRDGLHFLSKVLYHSFKERPYVLIDEFDAFIINTIFRTSFEIERSISFITKVMSNLLKSDYVRGSLIMAELRLVEILSTSEIEHFHFLENHKFVEYFGFIEDEIKEVLSKANMSSRIDEIQRRYDGYKVLERNLNMYCPLSVVSFLKATRLDNSWMKCDVIPYIDDYFKRYKINSKMQDLLRGETIRINHAQSPDFGQIHNLKEIIKSPLFFSDNECNIALFFNFMCEIGYLNVVKRHRNYIEVVIPNAEIGYGLHWKLHTQSYYRKTYKFDPGDEINPFTSALTLLGRTNDSSNELLEAVEGLYSGDLQLPRDDFEFRDIIHFCVHYYTNLEVFDGRRFYGSQNRRDLMIIRRDGTAIMMLAKFKGSSAYEALEELLTDRFAKVLNMAKKDRFIKLVILIGLHLNNEKKVNLCYLVNSTNIDEANILPMFSYQNI